MVNDVTWLCLAAGQGTRLRPITESKPKAMVQVRGRPLIDWLTDTARHVDVSDLAVVTGYRGEMIDDHTGDDVKAYRNPDYESTDMVRSLWCGEEALEGPVVLSYSDILYTPSVLRCVLDSPADVAVAVDEEWRSYWSRRHEDPVDDAESLELDARDRITSIGQAVESMAAPEAQYIGLIKLSTEGVEYLREAYEDARRADEAGEYPLESGRPLDELHMTDLLQGMIDRGAPVQATRIRGGWVEIDTPRDLEIARSVCRPTGDGTLNIDRSKSGSTTER